MVAVSVYYLLHGMMYSFNLMKIELGVLYALAGILIRYEGGENPRNLYWLISVSVVASGAIYFFQSDNWIQDYFVNMILIAVIFVCCYYFEELLRYKPGRN